MALWMHPYRVHDLAAALLVKETRVPFEHPLPGEFEEGGDEPSTRTDADIARSQAIFGLAEGTPGYTVMYWPAKGELRVVRDAPVSTTIPQSATTARYDARRLGELCFLPEHQQHPPRFATEADAWHYIAQQYPHLHP